MFGHHIFGLILISFASFLFVQPVQSAEKLNVIVLLVDDMGWTDLGYCGSDLYETPNIDRLAATGMRFTNAYAACTVCSPTRVAILTGQSPARVNVTDFIPGHRLENLPQQIPDWTQKLEHRHLTIAEILKDHGYRTAHVGKWHLTPRIVTNDVNSDGNFPEFYPQSQGFDVNIGGNEAGAPRSYFWPYGRGKGDARKQNNLFATLPDSKENYPEGTYLTDQLTDEAVKFIEQSTAKGSPFFLYFAYYNVHTPLQAKPELIEHYKAKLKDHPADHPKDQRHTNPVYAGMVHSVDDSVGRLVKTLRDQGVDKNTLIIFTSDNGGLTGAKGRPPVTSNLPLRQGKGSIYEGGVRVPAFVSWPEKTKPNQISSEPIISMDVLPTILEATNVEVPAQLKPLLDGVSLVPILTQKNNSLAKRNLYWHYPHYHMMGAIPYSAVRSGDWKLIEFFDERPSELYNLQNDIHEDHNLTSENPEIAKQLHNELETWRKKVDAQKPKPNPDYTPDRPTGRKSGRKVKSQQPLRE
ncbi:sulfatase [Thalassoglobus polymorphus]|uniref:Arylsulfatase n=1 Tax=Thalassoglobus polymorphus TaxID=2527994 RepID=A0A517QM68_9PLAN|nr:sulfatase [Thalassoglobus polymorphus]QDT32738.1 Arylsulfatase [Thalassoglobus polymorphus]